MNQEKEPIRIVYNVKFLVGPKSDKEQTQIIIGHLENVLKVANYIELTEFYENFDLHNDINKTEIENIA